MAARDRGRRAKRSAPAHYNLPPRFGLRLYVDWPQKGGKVRRVIDSGEAVRRFQRFLGGAHVRIDGWGYP